ncbi:hypothetical protein [Chamaesiphon sp. OTE_75_metabat_556]|uniref:hypothetical protein n=1 Tax=Chamaesiphon sp. OTE_75_metabat_556 TaxID=2964692 RepID=UPI00286B9632|nr:hypothetical protein [Chamaesiphon sp. OTE_75_metabat_556]
MNRQEAINYLKNLGLYFQDEKLLSFASLPSNQTKNVWWIDIPCEKITNDCSKQLSLILYKPEEKVVYYLVIPMQFIHYNHDLFARRDKSGIDNFSFELSLDSFIDIRPNGSKLSFKSFIHGAFKTI